MANVIYNSFKGKIGDDIDWNTDTIKIALVTSSYTPNQDTHEFFDDITNEVSGTGYTAGGEILANCSITVDNTNNLAKYDADNETWAASSITARGAVIYKSTGTASTSPLICYIDFGEDKTSTDGNFTITFAAEGIFNLT